MAAASPQQRSAHRAPRRCRSRGKLAGYRGAYQIDIFSLAEIAEATLEARELAADLLTSSDATTALAASLIAFAAYGGSGDRCLFDPARCGAAGEYAVLDAFHEVPGEWAGTVIADSFEDWLRRMCDSVTVHKQLLEYWTPTPLAKIVCATFGQP